VNIAQKYAIEYFKVHIDTKFHLKLTQNVTQGGQMEPSVSQGEPKGSRWGPKESPREPNGSQKGANWSQKLSKVRPTRHRKFDIRKTKDF